MRTGACAPEFHVRRFPSLPFTTAVSLCKLQNWAPGIYRRFQLFVFGDLSRNLLARNFSWIRVSGDRFPTWPKSILICKRWRAVPVLHAWGFGVFLSFLFSVSLAVWVAEQSFSGNPKSIQLYLSPCACRQLNYTGRLFPSSHPALV